MRAMEIESRERGWGGLGELGGGVRARREKKIPNRVARGPSGTLQRRKPSWELLGLVGAEWQVS